MKAIRLAVICMPLFGCSVVDTTKVGAVDDATHTAPASIVAPPDEPVASGGMGPLVAAPGDLAPFVFNSADSKFRYGRLNSQNPDSNLGGIKYVGDIGTYTVFANGFQAGIPYSANPIRKAPPLTQVSAEHNAHVLEYFETLGLPKEQVLGVDANAIIRETGSLNGGRNSKTLRGFFSIVKRQVHGVHVVESFAWARLAQGDEVVQEQIWWPPIPASVIADADRLQATLADAAKGPALRKSFPAEYSTRNAAVVIHHAAPHATSFWAKATVDVDAPDRRNAPGSFDEQGHMLGWNLRTPAGPLAAVVPQVPYDGGTP